MRGCGFFFLDEAVEGACEWPRFIIGRGGCINAEGHACGISVRVTDYQECKNDWRIMSASVAV